MGRREAVAGVLAGPTLAAMGLAGFAGRIAEGKKPDAPKNCLEVSRIGPDGLEPIEWDDMKAGDSVVIFDWCNGRIIGILKCDVVAAPDCSKPGHPVTYKGNDNAFSGMFCDESLIEIRCHTRPDSEQPFEPVDRDRCYPPFTDKFEAVITE